MSPLKGQRATIQTDERRELQDGPTSQLQAHGPSSHTLGSSQASLRHLFGTVIQTQHLTPQSPTNRRRPTNTCSVCSFISAKQLLGRSARTSLRKKNTPTQPLLSPARATAGQTPCSSPKIFNLGRETTKKKVYYAGPTGGGLMQTPSNDPSICARVVGRHENVVGAGSQGWRQAGPSTHFQGPRDPEKGHTWEG